MLNNLLGELALIWKNRRWLSRLFGTPPKAVTAYRSEMNPDNLRNIGPLLPLAVASMMPRYNAERRRFQICPYVIGHYPDEPGTEWYFVNGILTAPEMAILNAEYLAELFQRPIRILYNPTNGILADLVECVEDRTLNHRTALSNAIATRIMARLSAGNGYA